MNFEIRDAQIARLQRDRYAEQVLSYLEGYRAAVDPQNANLILTDWVGRATQVALTGDSLPESVITPEGRTYRVEFEKDGRLRRITNHAGYTLRLNYDTSNRVSQFFAGGSEVWRLRYDPPGRLEEIKYPDSTTTRFRYGEHSETLTITNRLGHTEKFIFVGTNLVSLVDGIGNETRFEYGGWDRPDRAIFPDGRIENYFYDEAGALCGIQHSSHQRVQIENNSHGSPIVQCYSDGQVLNFAYDDKGNLAEAACRERVVKFRWNSQGRLIEEDANGSTIRYAHDDTGRLVALTYPSGDTVKFAYDKDDRLVSVVDWNGKECSWAYSSDDRTYVQRLSNGITSIVALSPDGVPTSVMVNNRLGEKLFETVYNFNNELRVTSLEDSDYGTRRFEYDAEGHLLSLSDTSGVLQESFAYDGVGNLVDYNGQAATFNNLNQLMSQGSKSYVYDDRGNSLQSSGRGGQWRLTWDERNLLIRTEGPSGEQVTFGYDAFGRRIWKRRAAHEGNPESISRYIWAGEQLIEEVFQTGSYLRRQEYLYVPGTFVPLATRIDEKVYAYHCDHRGTPTRLTDDVGNVVWAATYRGFGQVEIHRGQIENSMRLPGQFEDVETGFYYNRFRYYSPLMCRYLSRDPMSFIGGPNLYAYVGNDPINRSDPLGLWWKAALSVVAGVAAAAAVVLTAPVSLPLIAVGAAAAAIGVGVGIGVNKVLNLKEAKPAEMGKAFLSGFVKGALFAGAVVGAIVAFPAAATGIAVAAAGVGIYSMCQEHFGWELMPWEKGSIPYSQMTPDQQNRSLGNLGGQLTGAAIVGAGANRFVFPRIASRLPTRGAEQSLGTPPHAAREAALAEAGRAQAVTPNTAKPKMAGAMEVNGKTYSASSKRGDKPPVLHPKVQETLDSIPPAQRSAGHGRCAEPQMISKALDEGVNPQGGTVSTVKVRPPGNPQHGQVEPPCASCRILIDRFGIKWEGDPPGAAVPPGSARQTKDEEPK